jgi:acetyl esterase/lipase
VQETNSKVAAAAGMGVLALDYRSLAKVPLQAHYPVPIEDVIAGLDWLRANGAGPLYLHVQT